MRLIGSATRRCNDERWGTARLSENLDQVEGVVGSLTLIRNLNERLSLRGRENSINAKSTMHFDVTRRLAFRQSLPLAQRMLFHD